MGSFQRIFFAMIFAAIVCPGSAQNATLDTTTVHAPRNYYVVSEPMVDSFPLSGLETTKIPTLPLPEANKPAQVNLSRVILMSTGYFLVTAKVAAIFSTSLSSSFSSHV